MDKNPFLKDTNTITSQPFHDDANPFLKNSQSNMSAASPVEDVNPFLANASIPDDVTQAQKNLGSQAFDDYCQAFVEYATGSGRQGSSAADAWNNQLHNARAGLNGIKPGDAIYFAPDSSNEGFGHTGIWLGGNNEFISATYNGVKATPLHEWQKETGQQVLGYIPREALKGGRN